MTVNRSYTLGVAKEELVGAFLAPPAESAALMDAVVEELRGVPGAREAGPRVQPRGSEQPLEAEAQQHDPQEGCSDDSGGLS